MRSQHHKLALDNTQNDQHGAILKFASGAIYEIAHGSAVGFEAKWTRT
jgi:hypothetical protein